MGLSIPSYGRISTATAAALLWALTACGLRTTASSVGTQSSPGTTITHNSGLSKDLRFRNYSAELKSVAKPMAETMLAEFEADGKVPYCPTAPFTLPDAANVFVINDCTEAGLQSALQKVTPAGSAEAVDGLRFECQDTQGQPIAGTVTISLTKELVLKNSVQIDGENHIVLDAQKSTRIFHADNAYLGSDYSIRNIVLKRGNAAATAECRPDGTAWFGGIECSGGAFLRNWQGGSKDVSRWGRNLFENVSFISNQGVQRHNAMGGGALFVRGSRTLIRDCTFDSNTGANGGALSFLQAPVVIYGSVFSKNIATGSGGTCVGCEGTNRSTDPRQGGMGGAIYLDAMAAANRNATTGVYDPSFVNVAGYRFVACGNRFDSNSSGPDLKGLGGGAVIINTNDGYSEHPNTNSEAIFVENSFTNNTGDTTGLAAWLKARYVVFSANSIQNSKLLSATAANPYVNSFVHMINIISHTPGKSLVLNNTFLDNDGGISIPGADHVNFASNTMIGSNGALRIYRGSSKDVTRAAAVDLSNNIFMNTAQPNNRTNITCESDGSNGDFNPAGRNVLYPNQTGVRANYACLNLGNFTPNYQTGYDPKLSATDHDTAPSFFGLFALKVAGQPQLASTGSNCPIEDELRRPRSRARCAVGAAEVAPAAP